MTNATTTTSTEEAPAATTVRKEAPGILKRSNSYFVDPAMVDDDGSANTRFDLGDIECLAGQIEMQLSIDPASGGLLNDIRVVRKSDGRFTVIDGRRRLSALHLLMKKGIVFPVGVPAKIDKIMTDVEALRKMFLANEGKAFLPLEEAAAYEKFRIAGLTVKQIGDIVGRKHMHVSQMLALIDADESLKQALISGKISKQMAKDIAATTKGDKEAQKELTAQASAVGKNTKDAKGRKAVKQAIQAKKVQKAAKKGRALKMCALDDDQLKEMGEKLSKHLVVLMKEAGIKEATTSAAFRAMVAKSEPMAVAFTFGAIEALKAAAGLKISLEL